MEECGQGSVLGVFFEIAADAEEGSDVGRCVVGGDVVESPEAVWCYGLPVVTCYC